MSGSSFFPETSPLLTNLLDRIHDYVVHFKEGLVEKHGKSDVPATVVIQRNEDAVAVVHYTEQMHIPKFMGMVRFAAYGYDADEFAIIFEGYMGVDGTGLNPVTGHDWNPGEMAELFDHPDNLEKNYVHEALIIMVANRRGRVAVRNLPYRVEDKKVSWLSTTPERSMKILEPTLALALSQMGQRKSGSIDEILPRDWPSTLFERDAWTSAVLVRSGYICGNWINRKTMRTDPASKAHWN